MKILIAILAFTSCFTCFSQEWSDYKITNEIKVEVAKIEHNSASDGINHERLVFKYTNLTSSDIKLQLDRKVAYDNSDINQSKDKTYTISIPANGVVEYGTSNNRNKAFYIFLKDLKGTIKRKLSNFELTSFNIQ